MERCGSRRKIQASWAFYFDALPWEIERYNKRLNVLLLALLLLLLKKLSLSMSMRYSACIGRQSGDRNPVVLYVIIGH